MRHGKVEPQAPLSLLCPKCGRVLRSFAAGRLAGLSCDSCELRWYIPCDPERPEPHDVEVRGEVLPAFVAEEYLGVTRKPPAFGRFVVVPPEGDVERAAVIGWALRAGATPTAGEVAEALGCEAHEAIELLRAVAVPLPLWVDDDGRWRAVEE